jgi:LmbE family N-acetylglucosaminyl deacetylase
MHPLPSRDREGAVAVTMRALAVLALVVLVCPGGARAQKAPADSAAIQFALDRLNTRGAALMIAAHPDDENTALLSWLAQGRNVRTGYLSLTRGEGGQNLIGSEQGYLLGLIRTQELLAARRIDGAEQFFTRAVDFGFSKSVDETLAKWGRDQVLGDIVYVIRKFRPDVIVLRFSGTPRDGHGHHQSSAILGREAFFAAADPARFPEQLKEVEPWKAKRVVWNTFAFTREQEKEAEAMKDRLEVDLGEYNPLLGYSYSEIAGISRSQHRSQGMGSQERRGSVKNHLVHVAGDPATRDLFDGVDLGVDVPALAEAARNFDPRDPSKVVPLLLKARPMVQDRRKQRELDETVAMCTGLWLDATTDRPMAAVGSKVTITAHAVNRSRIPVELVSIYIKSPQNVSRLLAYNTPFTTTTEWTAERVKAAPLLSEPEHAPLLSARFIVRVQGEEIVLTRPVWNRYVDRVRGELTRPFVVVPPVSLTLAEPTRLFPAAGSRTIAVQLRAWGGSRTGSVRLSVPAGWSTAPVSQPFSLTHDGQQMTVNFNVTPPSAESVAQSTAIATVNGQELSSGVLTIDYPHIPPQTLFPPAAVRLVRTDVKVLSRRIGYVEGAGDEVPDALRQMGCEVTLLSAEDLTRGDLSRYDAIVTGVRAYNTRADLRANQQRLLDYVAAGGTMVVQYNVLDGGPRAADSTQLSRLGPYPLKISRERVTVEDSPVEVLKAGHPLLSTPNRITQADWSGWVQERGLYFAGEWDAQYETVIASQDPGEKSLPGGLLYARHGKGAYVFTAYSWFRQLPAGVPGAYRIFANLLSAGQKQ